MNTPINCTDSELSTFLQGLAEGYLPTYYSDTNPSAPSRSNPIASKSYTHGKKTVSFLGFPSLTMLKHLTESRGEDLSKSSRADFHVRTFPVQEKEPESAESAADCGEKWQEWFAKLDPDTFLWKTRQCSLFEDLDKSLETWPRWGMMRNGVCLELATPAHLTKGKESGYLPTPRATDGDKGTRTAEGAAKEWARGKNKDLGMVAVLWPTPRAGNPGSRPNGKGGKVLAEEVAIAEGIRRRGKVIFPTPRSCSAMAATITPGSANADNRFANLETVVGRMMWPTPLADDASNSGKNKVRRETLASRVDDLEAGPVSGQLNPTWVEWLMGWPLGWTDLKPLETDKFRQWPLSHGEHSAKE